MLFIPHFLNDFCRVVYTAATKQCDLVLISERHCREVSTSVLSICHRLACRSVVICRLRHYKAVRLSFNFSCVFCAIYLYIMCCWPSMLWHCCQEEHPACKNCAV